MRVQCYRNLHRGDWSIRVKGKVVDHRADVVLANVTFHVGAAEQKRIAAGAARSVHAWAVGDLIDYVPQGARVAISYRPKERASFFRRDTGAAIATADYVHFTDNKGAFAIFPA
jgi:hypothetical protein